MSAPRFQPGAPFARRALRTVLNTYGQGQPVLCGTDPHRTDGNCAPTSANQACSGGRGDGVGFHGNGKDAYVHAAPGGPDYWVSVLNADGTVRWSRQVSDDLSGVTSIGRGDAAIDESGRVIVVYAANPDVADGYMVGIMGRLFDAAGNPLGKTFYVSEKEVPDPVNPPAGLEVPRVAWRNGNIAIAWISKNDPTNYGVKEVAWRSFIFGPPSLSIAGGANSVTISWPPGVTGFTLKSSSTLGPGAVWNPVTTVNNSVTVVNPAGNMFYQLRP